MVAKGVLSPLLLFQKCRSNESTHRLDRRRQSYTTLRGQRLCHAASGRSFDHRLHSVEVLAPIDWGVRSVVSFAEQLRQRQVDILHIQYPSIGNRRSLCPHIIGKMRVAKKVVVTLHEYSALPMLQRASTQMFRSTADCIVFTAEEELAAFGQSRVMQQVIHIGSNVQAFPLELPRTPTVVYFGQIRPQKGLEAFLELARRSLELAMPFRYRVIGTVSERRAEYYKALREVSNPEVEWLIDSPFDRVAELMASSLAAYLPIQIAPAIAGAAYLRH